jgi:site-specific DNA-methyltransferase (adenine-specific)
MNDLYFGDNLDVLRQHIKDDSVDLVYLDPPFKSNQDYNVLFRELDGTRSASQVRAFEDTWQWNHAAADAFQQVVEHGGKVSLAMQAFRRFLGETDMLAYLSMMAPRLVELRRVLKSTGSLYLHCDPTASHYLKMLLDAVFGPEHFLNEVVWRRTGTHSSARRWGPVHDTILYYARSQGHHMWNRLYVPLSEVHRRRHYHRVDGAGRVFTHGELTAPGTRHGRSGVSWKGFDVTAIGRHWITTVEKLDEFAAAGRIYFPPDGGWPRLIRYQEESKGRAIGDVWEDIPPLNMMARERLGYPTQKPVALLERMIQASSGEGGTVLDPFCGCGTTVDAAQRLKREWIGIDITYLAVALIKHRLQETFGSQVQYRVRGEPTSLHDAEALAAEDPYQFQWWALSLVRARPVEQKKGADRGIDGRLFFHDEGPHARTKQVILSVKSGSISVKDIRDLRGVIEREQAQIGVLISLRESTRPMRGEAASSGFYTSSWGSHPRLQILTIAELFEAKGIDYPGWINMTFRRAPRPRPREYDNLEIPLER